MTQIRAVLADDHNLVRAGVRALLEKLPDVSVVGEAQDGREALRLIETSQPDVALLDLSMPGLNGLEVTARVGKVSPATRVLVVSVHADPESILDAIDAGAAGYLLKDAGAAELEIALRSVVRGGTYLSPSVSRHVLDELRRRSPAGEREAELDDRRQHSAEGAPRSVARAQLGRLTPRQREILQLLAEGASSRKMARLLDLSVKTIETHRAQLMERLGIHDVPGLVRFAIRAGVVRIEDA